MELGGNNAMIVTPSADMKLTLQAIMFSAVGTCGQRCTTLRRIIAHKSIYSELVENFFNQGYTNENLVDLILQVSDKTAMNYLHNLTKIPVDFPLATKLEVAY